MNYLISFRKVLFEKYFLILINYVIGSKYIVSINVNYKNLHTYLITIYHNRP